MKLNNLRKQANEKGFTLIELMIVIAIIGILAAVAIPNFIEYKNKSYCTATINDVNALGGALADYFANPANTTASTFYKAPEQPGGRPEIFIGNTNYHTTEPPSPANTLLLSTSTRAGEGTPTQAAGALKAGPNYLLYAIEGAGNCPMKITTSDKHWFEPSDATITLPTAADPGAITATQRTDGDNPVAFFKTL
ncbi:MAG: type II secretion system protein [Candidatus Electrothrix aestuarii]|uniref:Type II secretion system protein n=1 Tax=Candidatus Electrothrix aestuarii TaxID=3062594 RepID=A0AAU8LS83_9BACT|nr:type II secretion system protein [Candidatus Electrothrix aestuarii]